MDPTITFDRAAHRLPDDGSVIETRFYSVVLEDGSEHEIAINRRHGPRDDVSTASDDVKALAPVARTPERVARWDARHDDGARERTG